MLAACLLAACSEVSSVGDRIGHVFHAQEAPPRTVVTRKLPPAAEYPNLASVPARPEATSQERRDAEMARLEADRAAASAIDDAIRERGPTPPPLAPGAEQPASPLGALTGMTETGARMAPPAAAAASATGTGPAVAATGLGGTERGVAEGPDQTASGFEPGADRLTQEGQALLERVGAREQAGIPAIRVRVGGTGKLREDREVLAKAILVARGVPVRAVKLGPPLAAADGLAIEQE